MAAAPKFDITYLNGRKATAIAGPRAQVACERHFKKGIGEIVNSGAIETVYFLAWAALHFSGQEAADFDQFLNDIEEVDESSDDEGEEVDDDATPTLPAS